MHGLVILAYGQSQLQEEGYDRLFVRQVRLQRSGRSELGKLVLVEL